MHGMRDISPQEWNKRQTLLESMRNFLKLHGYQSVDTPILEDTDLFLRKSGGELAAKMFTFINPGGSRVSLRPEFTSSIVRAYVTGVVNAPLPIRLQCSGPVFRYEVIESADYHQFTQVSAEILGASGPMADAETVFLASALLSRTGLKKHRIILGHVGAINDLLESIGLTERTRVFLLGNMGLLSCGGDGKDRVREMAQVVGLFSADPNQEKLSRLLKGLDDEMALELIQWFLKDTVNGPMGSREPEEVFARFLQKLKGTDGFTKFEVGLDLMSRLALLRGAPAEVLREAASVIKSSGIDPAPLNIINQLIEAIGYHDLESVPLELDLGMVRGIAYYTGLVFSIEHPAIQGQAPLCGGGRYDGLVSALGGAEDVPALGFACSVERIIEAIVAEGEAPTHKGESSGILVMCKEPRFYLQAQQLAQMSREQGITTQIDLNSRSVEQNMDYAKFSGLGTVVVVGADGSVETYPIDGAQFS
jgi:histidyl-tRNA synthetase